MEHGTASTGGSGDRRKTVSGPFPPFDVNYAENDGHIKFSSETMRFPWSATDAPSSPTTPTGPVASTHSKSTAHKRSLSGSILAKFNFLGRPPSRGEQDGPPTPKSPKSTKSRKSIDDDNETAVSPVSPVKGESAMAAALKSTKTRKRKGSLRKTALLGGRRLVTEGRERKNSLLQRSPSSKQVTPVPAQQPLPVGPAEPIAVDFNQPVYAQSNDSNSSLRNNFSYESVDANNSSDSGWSESAAAASARLSLLTEHKAQHTDRKTSTELTSPLELKSPVSQASYTSTTDDDDVLTFDRSANSFAAQSLSLQPLSPTATSYFPSVASVSDVSIARRLSSKKRSSPLSHNITTLTSFPEPETHDYTETEFWGWVILFVTWLTFTVGMGSCLEIWSWAWDVGETPSAPPDLEDDPTLPIVGYYPALIVLTGVVAWVWITVAWIGMKYFRHAKIEV
ncbi:hypothetical protein CLAFUW4_11076 [Fulvia fulva]|uniref:Uncharacterized protein n=1 Tax=Passalora fulva TaxID=5499 RepID=A0A9Q8PBU4_PASFU|nr:uncharacterized protein CLAFUR5_10119 [Fulvia fulva]KAK4620142.1 hypothetical protein CLAFUR4_11081 [Fulvia fulva]KAK4620434.1 hypothetical protein CLAFUR0_11087 [Fulvia fulva]UJO19580.1 hypothetical protein CLAFUR5_10119 [Fulvia fulva]WPV17632.1 hypothetical protein CLAFUW4_11076 [Fulvia fulva]WPV32156.1 hypothetical protein CLAFUW7_11073 [Fulvia fulva]